MSSVVVLDCGCMSSDRSFSLLHRRSEDRIRKGAEKLQKSLGKKQQGRLDTFFTKAAPVAALQKRKPEDDKKGAKKSRKK